MPSTLGALIDAAELGRKRLSPEQRRLAEANFDGRPQVIRGVAGSGKTAVLVKNLANLLDRRRNGTQLRLGEENRIERVLVVGFNRTIIPLLRQMLDVACLELMHTKLPPQVDVTHIAGVESLLYSRAKARGLSLEYVSYRSVSGEEKGKAVAARYCQQIDELSALQRQDFRHLQYDSIYIDEGQDLFNEEYELLIRLLHADTKTGEKNIIIFYDDAQNLYGRPLPNWSRLGIQVVGRSSIMKTCYRNPKQIVEFAYNLVLGAAATTRVLTRKFARVEELINDNLVEELSDRWLVHFAARDDGETPSVKLFTNREEEVKWLFDQLEWLIKVQGVQPHEILLVSQEPWLYSMVLASGINARVADVTGINTPYGEASPSKDKFIFSEGVLTLATVYAAKGYDCPVVILLGADDFPITADGRALFYVAATRAKMRLYVSGLHKSGSLAEEAEAVSRRIKTPPVPVREEVSVVFQPAFHKGERVRDGRDRTGTVVADAEPKQLPSQKGDFQEVRIDFGGELQKIVWPLAMLERV